MIHQRWASNLHQASLSSRFTFAHSEPTITDKQKKQKTVFIRSISLVCFSSTNVTKVTFMHYCNIQSRSCYCVTLLGMFRCYFCIMCFETSEMFLLKNEVSVFIRLLYLNSVCIWTLYVCIIRETGASCHTFFFNSNYYFCFDTKV